MIQTQPFWAVMPTAGTETLFSFLLIFRQRIISGILGNLRVPKKLNIKSYLESGELEICQRVRESRLILRKTQSEFASDLGIPRKRLASYEYGLAPIRYDLGKEICFRFGINQRWLAKGIPPRLGYFDVSPHLEYKIPKRTLFSEAYSKQLEPVIEDRMTELKGIIGDELGSNDWEDALLDTFPQVGSSPEEELVFLVRKILLTQLVRMPPFLKAEYSKSVIDYAMSFYDAHVQEIETWLKTESSSMPDSALPEKTLVQYSLTSKSESSNPIEVKRKPQSEWEKLRTRLIPLTEPRGVKSALAKRFNVSRQAVTGWLHATGSKNAPSAEIALQLLLWVEEEEAKRNSPGSVAPLSGQRTQKRKSKT